MMSGDECARQREIAARREAEDLCVSGSVSDGIAAPDKHWYVVQTQAYAELRAVAHLERQGYRIFCPRYRKSVRHARKVRSVLAPLFPNYLFVSLDISREPWRAINGTSGVVSLIGRGERPLPVPAGVVEALLASAQSDGTIEVASRFSIGDTVRVVEGPFADLVGTLEMLDSSDRVRILLDLLGRPVSVAMCVTALVPAA